MKNNLAIIGMQWGDEGKGKIVDLFSDKFDIVARYQGGNNAGHTVMVNGKTLVLHTIPSGALHPKVVNVIGSGMVINPEALIEEIKELETNNIDLDGRLFISDRAHLIMPYHMHRDMKSEKMLGDKKIGTTSKGIGPTYGDKVQRRGIRAFNLRRENLDKHLNEVIEANLLRIQKLYNSSPPSAKDTRDKFKFWQKELSKYITDTSFLLTNAIMDGKKVLFEGAQGTLLDIDHGTYPYVTSSNATVGGISAGLGIPPKMITNVLGIVKAYTTRVGEGPFPTEINDENGRHLQKQGQEFGATTGRPRRCGWFDLVVARYAVRINGLDFVALTKLDVLDQLDTIKICTGYKLKSSVITEMPASPSDLEKTEPLYEEMPGWKESTTEITSFSDLPKNAQAYINYLEQTMNCPIAFISTGPGREEGILRKTGAFSKIINNKTASGK